MQTTLAAGKKEALEGKATPILVAKRAMKRLSRPGTAFCSWMKTFCFSSAAASSTGAAA